MLGALQEWGLGIKTAWMGDDLCLEGLEESRSPFGAAARLKFGFVRGEKDVCALVLHNSNPRLSSNYPTEVWIAAELAQL